ncbi:hypothetical protein GCM10007071_23850 [Marinobacter zhanjiangensis]|uniref:Uncharacterized protein n=1 Tax=Marinobacter zhanjiangensis TaxID=578215 RepID=A0ABQ3B5J7_9GAMM|nr:hypothetical protein GCM10007071_23850 [Marinobacter zhanjiangensis]
MLFAAKQLLHYELDITQGRFIFGHEIHLTSIRFDHRSGLMVLLVKPVNPCQGKPEVRDLMLSDIL